MSRPLIEVFDEYFARLTIPASAPTLRGMPRPPSPQTTRVEEMLREGTSHAEIASATGLTTRTIRTIAARLGIGRERGDRGPAASPRGRAAIAVQVLAELEEHPTQIAEARARLGAIGLRYTDQGLRALRLRWLG